MSTWQRALLATVAMAALLLCASAEGQGVLAGGLPLSGSLASSGGGFSLSGLDSSGKEGLFKAMGASSKLGHDDSCVHIFFVCCEANQGLGKSCQGKHNAKGAPLIFDKGDDCVDIFLQCCKSKAKQDIEDDTCEDVDLSEGSNSLGNKKALGVKESAVEAAPKETYVGKASTLEEAPKDADGRAGSIIVEEDP